MSPKQKKILIIITIIIFILAGSILVYSKYGRTAPVEVKKTTTKITPTPTPEPPKPILAESPLDGTMVAPEIANRHPLAIMIENHPQSRPQAGLIDASIVYEALAEGGISRFMGIFGPKIPAKAGPVRSARTYYVDWTEEYDAFYAHVGGANDALNKINADGVKDLNQFAVGAAAFWREKSAGVALEHTMFTDPLKLYNYSFNNRKWPQTSTFTSYKFKDDAPIAERSKGGTLSIDISGNATYASKFIYDSVTNNYQRTMAGVAHKDRISGLQIAPKNVIIQYANEIYKAGKKDHDVQTVGSGQAKIFIDGKMTEGTWSKASSKSRTIFKDATGAQIITNRGQTWITVLKPGAPVTWTPTI